MTYFHCIVKITHCIALKDIKGKDICLKETEGRKRHVNGFSYQKGHFPIFSSLLLI